MAAHLTQQQRIEFNFEQELRSETWQGSFDELHALFEQYANSGPDRGDGMVWTGGALSRREGDRGVLEMSAKICTGYSWWGFSFAEVSKPIRTWLAIKMGSDDTAVQRELSKIDRWEMQKNEGTQGLQDYEQFKYDGTNVLTGDTLELAKKIKRGIESYSIYMPVATCRRMQTTPFTDGLNQIGRYRRGLVSPTEQIPANRGQLAAVSALKEYWLKTGDEISQNSDGTLSRTETWQGLDDIDKDLYQQIT